MNTLFFQRRYKLIVLILVITASLPFSTKIGRNLEYEYTLMISYLTIIILPLFAFFFPFPYNLLFNGKQKILFIPIELAFVFIICPVVIAILPIVTIITNYCPCGGYEYPFWMLVQWYPIFILSFALYYGISRLLFENFSKRKVLLGMIASFMVIAVYVVLQLWLHPQKRITNLFFGFIHGPIYDSWITLDKGILLARLFHFFIAILIISVSWIHRSIINLAFLIGSITCCIILFFLSDPYYSIQNGKKYLDKLLPNTMVSKGFSIHYKNDEDPFSENHIKRLFDVTNFHINELKKVLGNSVNHVDIYVYPNEDKKKLWFGAGNTDVTDVVTPSIHLTKSSPPFTTIRHELVHALTSSFAYYGLGFHPNMAFTEGLAMALAPSYDNLTLDEGAYGIISTGKIVSIDSLFTPGFFLYSGARAYTVAGSMINHLIATYGFEKVKSLYSGGSFEEVFGIGRSVFLNQWLEKIAAVYDHDKHHLQAQSLYKYGGAFFDLCVHSKATLRKKVKDNHFVRLRQPPLWDPENDYWHWRVAIDKSDEGALLNLFKSEIRKIAIREIPLKGRLNTWKRAIRNARRVPPLTFEDIELGILESDIYRITGDRNESLNILRKLAEPEIARRLGDNLLRKIFARIMVEKSLTQKEALPWRKYLAGWQSIPKIKSVVSDWIFIYLRLRSGSGDLFKKNSPTLLLEAKVPKNIPATFKVEWYRLLGFSFLELNSFQLAHKAFTKATKVATGAKSKLLDQYSRMAIFLSQ